jgi:hypothetical protein
MIFRTDVTIRWYIVLHILLYLYNNNKRTKNKKMSKEQILGLIRHSLTAIGGAVVMLGYFDEALVTEITGGIMTAVGFIWSYIDKVKKS